MNGESQNLENHAGLRWLQRYHNGGTKLNLARHPFEVRRNGEPLARFSNFEAALDHARTLPSGDLGKGYRTPDLREIVDHTTGGVFLVRGFKPPELTAESLRRKGVLQ
jgi:hypothetical protein